MNYTGNINIVATLSTGKSGYRAAPKRKFNGFTTTNTAKTTGAPAPRANINQAMQLTPAVKKSERKRIQQEAEKQRDEAMVTEHCTTSDNIDYNHNNVELAINGLHKSHVNKATNKKVKHTRNISNRSFLDLCRYVANNTCKLRSFC